VAEISEKHHAFKSFYRHFSDVNWVRFDVLPVVIGPVRVHGARSLVF
jgi:hypothetical protein